VGHSLIRMRWGVIGGRRGDLPAPFAYFGGCHSDGAEARIGRSLPSCLGGADSVRKRPAPAGRTRRVEWRRS
jgi:hypothetical protein